MAKKLEAPIPSDETDGDNRTKGKQNISNGADIFDGVTQDGFFQRLSPRVRPIVGIVGTVLLCSSMYLLNGEMAKDKTLELVSIKSTERTAKTGSGTDDVKENVNRDPYGLHEGLFSTYPIISTNNDGVQSSPVETPVVGDGGVCPALCDSREKARKTKFDGDLLDLTDVLQMANKAHDKLVDHIKLDYGQYFDGIFLKEPAPNTTKPRQYSGMEPVTADGQSRNRLKRKLQLKVLKMMEALKISEEDVHGCNCRTKTGSTTEKEESFTSSIPDYYQKYVFANGGHSNAAGHGNVFTQTYTHYIGEDLRIIWDALGVEMINRNMAMGTMRASPDISTCSKEVFGVDVDLLTWNFAMTDKSFESWLHYVYRGAVNPGRPAFVSLDIGNLYEKYGGSLEEMGLSLFWMVGVRVPTNKNIPDSAPEGIPLADDKLNELPPMVKRLICNGRMEGQPTCDDNYKWSCTKKMRKKNITCTCPGVRKRSGWHMGFKRHNLDAHYMSLPIVEMLLEGLSELVATGKDPKTLFQELQKEEDEEFEGFLSVPIEEKFGERVMERFGELGDELDTWFKGPSLCRTSLLPSMTRYLGLAMNSDKVGGSARCEDVEYETGIFFDRENGVYNYTDGTPPEGEMSIVAPNDFRDCWPLKVCSEVVMPDYKDWFYGNWTNGPVSITFPNEKEREYYGYEPGKFKGILGLVSTIFTETAGKKQFDFEYNSWHKYVNAKVNGKPVTKWKTFNRMAILEGADGIYWEPSGNNDYTFEFSPKEEMKGGRLANDLHFRLQGFVLY
eukprot:CAMPEP_0113633838 /NCGR_PEP_ID=MMETSP0017_2-20120614/17615_1 /TAXON_ID=2856 /ORGANISM="Cylindrotheca closterium" /LENGTH=783 /DNA_ID=CAMNT_0000544503 /DNA_START=94 /DNA_END=2445 /DNA_ORIENTATION=+ /assembly_acc=CAM_ASM_000147